jgi:hypothetical protein
MTILYEWTDSKKITHKHKKRLKTLVQRVTLVACILDMPGSNRDRDSYYPDGSFSVPPDKRWDSTLHQTTTAS